jgi:LAO/AO transport system kinase
MWIPPIQKTVAVESKGIVELAESIGRHVVHLRQSGDWAIRERARLEVELEALIREALLNRFREDVPQEKYEDVLEKVMQRNVSPWEAVKMLLNGR